MSYNDRTCCPHYSKICAGLLPETCANCPYYTRVQRIMRIGKIALIIAALLFVVTTGCVYY